MTLKRLLHWGPLLALFIMKFVSLTTMIAMGMWLPSNNSLIGLINFLLYCTQLGLMIYNFFCSVFQGPGYVPLGWKPDKEKIEDLLTYNEIKDLRLYLQYCEICKGYKAPRSHHCRKCNRCILKMDHHCPWINTCCGHRNHAYFIYFLLFAVTGAIHSLILLSMTIYQAYYAAWYFYNSDRARVVYLSFKFFVFVVLSIGFSIGVILGVGFLFYIQLKIAIRNQTSIEEWITTKANARTNNQFIYPYDLGCWQNLKQLFFLDSDGINWPTKPECHEFSLTAEQVQQKQVKRENTKYFVAQESYNGQWFPLFSQGFWTCVNFPFSDEPRIKFNSTDILKVTRSKKYWLYGEIENKSVNAKNRTFDCLERRGWFPSRCVVEMVNVRTNKSNDDTKKTK